MSVAFTMALLPSRAATMFAGDRCETASECSTGLCEPVPRGAKGAAKRCVFDSPNLPCQISEGSWTCDADLSDCFSDEDCSNGSCEGPDARPDCGGPAPPPGYNICVQDACDLGEVGEGGCGDQEVCVQRGTFGNTRNLCVKAYCASDSACSAGTNGSCEYFYHQCFYEGRSGLGCAYDESECRTSAECSGEYESCDFDFDAGKMQCRSPHPPPPTPSVASVPFSVSPVQQV